MKLADLDWNEVLAALPRWEAVSPEARHAFLQIKPGAAAPPAVLGRTADELVAGGLVLPPGPRATMYAHRHGVRPLLVALRAMDRHRALDPERSFSPETYLQDQMTLHETGQLSGMAWYGTYVDRAAAVERAFSAHWIKDFLAADTPEKLREWERPLLRDGESPRLAHPPVALALHALVGALAGEPHVRGLRELAGVVPDVPRVHMADALAAGLRYLLLFVSVRGRELEAVFGLLPSAARRLGPPPPAPGPVAVKETFEAPFRVADMTAVLVEAVAEPIRLRANDRRPYQRTEQAIAARLTGVPGWTNDITGMTVYGFATSDYEDEDEDEDRGAGRSTPAVGAGLRMALAIESLEVHGFARVVTKDDRLRLDVTKTGREWLTLSDGERLKQVLRATRASAQRVPGWWHQRKPGVEFFGSQLPFAPDESLDLRKPLAAGLLAAPAGEMVPLDAWIDHLSETSNPFLAMPGPKPHVNRTYGMPHLTREGWESVWRKMLDGFLRVRLVPLGGARLGRMENGELAFALTDAGRYLLGGMDDFTPPAPAAAEVVVQPDFEVVFLAPAPQAEAELGRFADRTGSGVGALFRLTRASILRAAETGLTADQVLKTLGCLSRTPVPANVARQVRDWFGATRRVKATSTILVECPDSETAARVVAMAGSLAKPVTRTLLRFDGSQKEVAALARKLKAKGIFLEG